MLFTTLPITTGKFDILFIILKNSIVSIDPNKAGFILP